MDDLVTLGTLEPYRMFTSRAEYRLLLREDNADLRLTTVGRTLGLVDDARWEAFSLKQEAILTTQAHLHQTWIRAEKHQGVFDARLKGPLLKDCRASEFLRRPEVRYAHLEEAADLQMPAVHPAVAEQVEIQSKYAGYIARQELDIARLKKNEATRLPDDFAYERISGLSAEVVQKLKQVKPVSIAQAGRISGVTPAALSLLLVHLKKQRLLA